MNTAAKHEAGHAVAIHFLGLTEILRPGGAAITSAGGGIVALDCEKIPDMLALVKRVDCNSDVPCEPAVTAARQRPDLAPALILLILAGYGATPETWQGDFSRTICVRTSSDFNTAKRIIVDLIGECWIVENIASEAARDALDRAVNWAAQSHIQAMIDRVAAHLDAHGAATWTELEKIFYANTETSRGESLAPSVFVPGETPLAGNDLGAVAGSGVPAAVLSSCAKNKLQHEAEKDMKE